MSYGIIMAIVQKVKDALNSGNFVIVLAGKLFAIEHVNGHEYRLTNAENADCGIRFMWENGQLSYDLA